MLAGNLHRHLGVLRRASVIRQAARLGLAALATVLIWGDLAGGTTLIQQSFDDLVAKSDHVVIADVADISAEITPDETKIYTYVTLESVIPIVGPEILDGTMTLRFSGGHVGQYHSSYLGMPEFEVGERLMLFVHLNGTAMCPIVGWTQGCFRVEDDGAREYVLSFSQNSVVGVDFTGNLQFADAPTAGPVVENFGGFDSETGEAAQPVVNANNVLPSLSVLDFIDKVLATRDWTGYQPEPIFQTANQWVTAPQDAGEANNAVEQLRSTLPLEAVPGRDDAYIPRPQNIEPEVPEDE